MGRGIEPVLEECNGVCVSCKSVSLCMWQVQVSVSSQPKGMPREA